MRPASASEDRGTPGYRVTSLAGRPRRVVEQLDSGILERDTSSLVKFAESLLESLFAHAKLFSDGLGRTVIIERKLAAVALKCLDDFVSDRGQAFLA